MFKLAEDIINKNPIISKVYLEKIFEFLPRHQIFDLKTMFLLVLLLNYHSIEKQSSKKDLIRPIGFNGFKIVLTFLVKIIAI